MKGHRFLLIGISMAVLFACGNDDMNNNEESLVDAETEEVATTQTNEGKPSDELTLESFGDALEAEGFTYEPVEKEAAFIGATAGQGYSINGNVVELYKYIDGSDIFEEIKDKGFIEIEDVIAFEVEINGRYALAASEHPNSEEIIEIFHSLDGSN